MEQSTAKGVIYYGSFPGGTKQGLHRNEQPPPTQQRAFLKGKVAVVANAVTPRSGENQKERLQYLAAGTAGTATEQGAGYGAITDKAAG